jgi:porphobilinogen synthase
MYYPAYRPRRTRRTETLRRMFSETKLTVDGLIAPYFVCHGIKVQEPIASMPGQFQWSIDLWLKELQEVADLKIPAIMLFGIPKTKDKKASEAYDPNGIVQQAIRAAKQEYPHLVIISDVCLCEYMDHGHCGVVGLRDTKTGTKNVQSIEESYEIKNDPTLELLAQVAVSHAKAGADIVAPSDMMDGRVRAIRNALDETGCEDTLILSYAAKYASELYAPFRNAAESAPQFGDRKTYQMNHANSNEALREVSMDLEEGADAVLVKPAMGYLDIVWRVKHEMGCTVGAYHVSGEYSMIKAAAEKGYVEEKRLALEMHTGIARAGADWIVTYFAKDIARWLK